MTEQTPEPTRYDEIQDAYINSLREVVEPSYEPPEHIEYSFPVVGQGISADQYRLMNLGQANGIIHGDNGLVNDSPSSTGYRYYLEGHATNAETNQRNTLMLRAGTSAEAILEGFYHRLTQDMELSFPPVTTPTTYYVCLTYDPLEENNPAGPISVQVYANTPPTSNRRVHLILHTVQRRANQLLSQATVTRYRPYTAGIVSVQNVSQLPDVDSYPAGTLAVPSSSPGQGIYVRSNTSPKRWINAMAGDWRAVSVIGGWAHQAGRNLYARVTGLGVQFKGAVNGVGISTASNYMFILPEGMRPPHEVHLRLAANPLTRSGMVVIGADGRCRVSSDSEYGSNWNWIDFTGVTIPID